MLVCQFDGAEEAGPVGGQRERFEVAITCRVYFDRDGLPSRERNDHELRIPGSQGDDLIAIISPELSVGPKFGVSGQLERGPSKDRGNSQSTPPVIRRPVKKHFFSISGPGEKSSYIIRGIDSKHAFIGQSVDMQALSIIVGQPCPIG